MMTGQQIAFLSAYLTAVIAWLCLLYALGARMLGLSLNVMILALCISWIVILPSAPATATAAAQKEYAK